MQPDGNFAVERDGAAEITDLAGCVFPQVLELFDEGGWFQVCPVFREPGCLRVVPVREIGMFRVLVEGGEHNPDFPEGTAVRPLPFGGQEIIGSADNLLRRAVFLQLGQDVRRDHTSVCCRMRQTGFQFVACIKSHDIVF